SRHPRLTTHHHTPSLHDALPIYHRSQRDIDKWLFLIQLFERKGRRLRARLQDRTNEAIAFSIERIRVGLEELRGAHQIERPSLGDRKSTRLNSSHCPISYAVFCF